MLKLGQKYFGFLLNYSSVMCKNYLLLFLFLSKSLFATWINICVTGCRIVTYSCIVTLRYFTNGLSTCCFGFKLASLLSMGHWSHESWVMGHLGHGSKLRWVTWVWVKLYWPIVSSDTHTQTHTHTLIYSNTYYN